MKKFKEFWKELIGTIKNHWLDILTFGLTWLLKKLKESKNNEELFKREKMTRENA